MKLVEGWRKILLNAWSIRLMLLGVLINGAALYWSAFEGHLNPWAFFAIGIVLQLVAAIARLIRQKGISCDSAEP